MVRISLFLLRWDGLFFACVSALACVCPLLHWVEATAYLGWNLSYYKQALFICARKQDGWTELMRDGHDMSMRDRVYVMRTHQR